MGIELEASEIAAACAGSTCFFDDGGDVCGEPDLRASYCEKSCVALRGEAWLRELEPETVDEPGNDCWDCDGDSAVLLGFGKGLIVADREALDALRSCVPVLVSDLPFCLEKVLLKMVPNPPRFSAVLLDEGARSIGSCASCLSSA